MKSSRWVISYIVAASIGLWFAFFLSIKFVTPAHSQETPSAQNQKPPAPGSGDLPPEFVDEVQKSPPAGVIPPPPTEPPQAIEPSPSPVSQPPASQAPATVDQIPPMETQPLPVVPQFAADEQYTYDSTGRRDPFKPYKAFRPTPTSPTLGGARAVDPEDPLQRWDLNRFAIVAIMWEVRNPRAMIKDPDGKLYMIGKATKIGRNSGQVVAIREGEVVVVETIENEGVVTKEVKVLELKK